ncbi:MAG: hypothetical protein AB4368_19275 [Xenococcaceae cyanobacterium]
MTESSDYKERFEKKFAPIFREIRELRTDIYHQEGFLFIRFHKYTVEELLQAEHYSKIDSFSKKIKDDVVNWDLRGNFSEIGKAEYKKICKRTKNALKRQGRRATLPYDELNFHISAPEGHLPRSLELRGKNLGFAGESRWMALFARLGLCMRRRK